VEVWWCAEWSRCAYSACSTSRSFFTLLRAGTITTAWKFTGSPYLQPPQTVTTKLLRKTFDRKYTK
jgi:hypothetical protein